MSAIEEWISRLEEDTNVVAGWGGFQRTATEDQLNRTRTRTEIRLSKAIVDEAVDLSRRGHRLTMELEKQDWRLTLDVLDGTVTAGSHSGEWHQPFSDDDADAEAEFREARHLDLAYRCAAARLSTSITAVLFNSPASAGFHWIRSTEGFLKGANDGRTWVEFAQQLHRVGQVQRLIIQDAGTEVVISPGLVTHGPGTSPPVESLYSNDQAHFYRQHYLTGLELCEPDRLAPTSHPGPSQLLGPFGAWLNRVANALTWMWLAEAVDLSDPSVPELRYEGWREVVVRLPQLPGPAAAAEAVALWRWSIGSTDSVRKESVQQAISLSVASLADFAGAAGAVLRTARYLNRLASQGPVAEALASRRAAREAAIASARSNADAIQNGVRRTVDRVLTLLGAALGIAIAHRQALLAPETAALLLSLVAGFVLVVFIAALGFEYPNASRSLNALRRDIRSYRDSLVEDDIQAIEKLGAIEHASKTLTGAAWMLAILALIAASALVWLFAYIDAFSLGR